MIPLLDVTIVLDRYTVAGLFAVLLAYPPIFRQARDAVLTAIAIVKFVQKFAALPDELHELEVWRDDHISVVGLHNGKAD